MLTVRQQLYKGIGLNHTVIGTIVVCLMVFQPALGFAHHQYYKKNQRRGPISHAHIWYGRVVIVFGIINGGLGMQLASAPQSFIVAYSIIAAVVMLLYGLSSFIASTRRGRRQKDEHYQMDSPIEMGRHSRKQSRRYGPQVPYYPAERI